MTVADRDSRPTLIGPFVSPYSPPPEVRTLALCAKLVASVIIAAGCVWVLVAEVGEERGRAVERESTDEITSEDVR